MGPPVEGCITRVEPTDYHQEFLKQVQPARAMLKLHHANRLVEEGYTASSWGHPEIEVITTSTINDETLDSISWSEERDIIEQFQPDYHIPTDVSVYPNQPKAERVDLITNCMKGAAFMQSELSDTPTAIIPLFKGETRSERNICLKAASVLDVDMVAIYVARYFSAKQGNYRGRMFRELNRYADQDMPDAMLVGLLSPRYLDQVPDYVVAASGQNQWRKRYEPDTQTTTEMESAYQQLESAVEQALGIDSQEQTVTNHPSQPAKGD